MKTKKSLKKSKKLITPSATQKLMVVARKPETWLGAVILGALLIIAFNSFFPRQFSTIKSESATIQKQSVTPASTSSATATSSAISPASSSSAVASPSAALVSTESAVVAPTATPAAQKEPLKVVVKPNQTFWELASRYCNDHDFAEKLASDNGYSSVTKLKTGDVVTITCAQ